MHYTANQNPPNDESEHRNRPRSQQRSEYVPPRGGRQPRNPQVGQREEHSLYAEARKLEPQRSEYGKVEEITQPRPVAPEAAPESHIAFATILQTPHFDQNIVQNGLRFADPSAHTVNGLSGCLRRWKDRACDICRIMSTVYCMSQDPNNQVAIFYVFNDVVQREKAQFHDAGMDFFLRVIAPLVKLQEERFKGKYLRTVDVWRQRGIYDKDFCDTMRDLYGDPSYVPIPPLVDPSLALPKPLRLQDWALSVDSLLRLYCGVSPPPMFLERTGITWESNPNGHTSSGSWNEARRNLSSCATSDLVSDVTLQALRTAAAECYEEINFLSLLLVTLQKFTAANAAEMRQILEKQKCNAGVTADDVTATTR